VKGLHDGSARLAAASLRLYLRAISSSLKIGIALEDGTIRSGDDDAIGEFVRQQSLKGPAIFPLWTSDQVNLLSLGFAPSTFRSFVDSFRFFVDDSFGGLLMASALRSLRGKLVSISQRDPADRLRGLRAFVSERPTAFLVVDGRGPYFTVSTGLINLARSIPVAIVPCSATAFPHATLRLRKAKVHLPIPASRILVQFGTPISYGPLRSTTAASDALSLQDTLLSLGAAGMTRCRANWK